jgi:cytochrome c
LGCHQDDRGGAANVGHWELRNAVIAIKERVMERGTITLASLVAVGLWLAGSTVLTPISPACAAKGEISYSEDIAPIFRGWCVSCHSAGGEGEKASGLDLTTYEGLMKGTKFGPMVVPGQPDESNLTVLIEGRGKVRMPFGHKALPNCLRQNIWSWIFEGAKNN